MNVSKRSDSRKNYTNGPANGHTGRGKPKSTNLTRNAAMEGVYGNSRFACGVTSLIGCPVQVEVKNGGIYEGIFLTFSPAMEIVLKMAHRVEDKQEGPYGKDQLIEAIIFKANDVKSIVATNVDLEFAIKDSFTDAAISKYSGEVIGRELERWDCDGPGVDLSLESGANGWGVEDMFKTNAEKYNVKSSYDDTLTCYTTVLEVDDTAEGKAKAARAARLASEIEGTDSYRHHVELENIDEGEAISAVIRETARDPATSDKYIPPAMRKQFSEKQNSLARSGKSVTMNGTNQDAASSVPSPHAMSRAKTSDADSEQDKNKKNLLKSPLMSSSKPLIPTDSQGSTDAESPPVDESETQPASPVVNSHKPLGHTKSEHTQHEEHIEFTPPALAASHHAKPRSQKLEHKKSGHDDRNAEISDLRDFRDNFKLSSDQATSKQSTETEKEKRGETKTPRQPSEAAASGDSRAVSQGNDVSCDASSTPEDAPEKKKSTLNPNAPEFTLNPHASVFKPSTSSVQVATSPRPQTQSPVIQQTFIHQPHLIPAYVMNPGPAMMPPEQQVLPKRAVVSVMRADSIPSAQNLAGKPLQAQPAGGIPGAQYTLQPIMFPGQGMPQNFAHGQNPMYNQQLVQMAANGHGLMNAQVGAQMQQIYPHAHQQMGQMTAVNVQQQQPQQQQHLFIPGPGGISQGQPPPLLPPNQQGHHHHQHYNPQLASRSTPPQQTSHAPNQGPQAQNPGQGQHQQMYHHNGQMPPNGQPPLQPSPHTPASPQAQQPPVISYSYSQPPIPTHTQNPAMHQMATNYMQVAPQVSYTAHHTHGPPPPPNHVVMVQQQHQHMQNQPHHLPHGPPQMPPNQMQGPVHMSQSGHPISAPQPGMGPMSLPAGLHYAPQPSPR